MCDRPVVLKEGIAQDSNSRTVHRGRGTRFECRARRSLTSVPRNHPTIRVSLWRPLAVLATRGRLRVLTFPIVQFEVTGD